jgi:16S rRNA processing protein RimM
LSEKLILVAHVAGAFGVKGEVRITTYTADPRALMDYGPLLRADGSHGLTLTAARPTKDGLVARAREIATKEEADAMRGLKLHVPRERPPVVVMDEGPLILVETKRDLGQMPMPFDNSASH